MFNCNLRHYTEGVLLEGLEEAQGQTLRGEMTGRAVQVDPGFLQLTRD